MNNEAKRDLCSPSQLQLRFHCPGSVALSRQLPAGSGHKSEAAERGTRLHSVVVDLLNGADIEKIALTPDDREAVDWCMVKIQDVLSRFEAKPIVKKEFQVDLSYLGIHGGTEGCRIDILIVIPGVGSIIIDLKFGEGYVPQPKYNWQFKAYACGAHNSFGGPVECVKLQPSDQNEENRYQACLFDDSNFPDLEREIKAIVDTANSPEAPLVRGKHCEYLWCKCKEICPLHRQAVLEIPQGITVKNYMSSISPVERGLLYCNLVIASKWVEKAITTIQSMAVEENLEITGYEVRDGKNKYEWANEAEATSTLSEVALDKGIDALNLIEPSHLKSKSAVEKILGSGKAVKAALEPLLVTIPGAKILREV